MKIYRFRLNISSHQYLDYYRGVVRNVIVHAESGQTVQFPAGLLQRFVAPDGIRGRFELQCNDDFTGARLRRLD